MKNNLWKEWKGGIDYVDLDEKKMVKYSGNLVQNDTRRLELEKEFYEPNQSTERIPEEEKSNSLA